MRTSSREEIINGSITKQLLLFFFPVVLGFICESLYNTIDAVIVGKYVGKEALAAVGGTTGTSLNLLINFIWGLTSGINVIIAQFYGRRDTVGVHNAVRTGMFMGLTLGLGMSIVGIIITPALLSLLNVPSEILPLSISYMRIFLVGLVPGMIYNVGAAILRATGDSRRPLYFLLLSAVINTVLDYIFVRYFKWGVKGAAIATAFAQFVCATLMLILFANENDCYRFEIKDLGYDKELLKKTILIGLPSGLQSVIYSVSNLFIQATVNSFGTNTVAAYTAFGKIDSFFWNYDSAFGVATMTIVGQNYGAGKIDRVKKSIKIALGLELIGSAIFTLVCVGFATPLTSIFTSDSEVILIGVNILKFIAPFWFLFNPVEIFASSCKACGNTIIPMIISAIGICGVRISYLLLVRYKDVIQALYCYPISWAFTALLFAIYLARGKWMKKRV